MMILIGCLFALIILTVIIPALRGQPRQSSQYLSDADWLEPKEKFRMIARWGAHR